MGTVSATVFKAKCLELMDRVAEKRVAYVITKRGQPVARLVPVTPRKKASLFGYMRGRMEIVGDIEKPLWSDDEWKEFERQRIEQARAWDQEWRKYGTISGKKTVGSPRRAAPRGPRRGRRPAPPTR